MGMFSGMHWVLIGAVALLLFGNRLPEVARSLGRSVNEFKKGFDDIKFDVEDAVRDDDKSERLKQPKD
ncbi:MAG: twin-arginine translocase TatA/TatE family subunit [Planctomycetes bacterium]|nr:twin-arginine translocase TatA/TatE family subunit [Planctomycetota bacterium]